MKSNKKGLAYAVLFVVFLAQIIFSGTISADANTQTEDLVQTKEVFVENYEEKKREAVSTFSMADSVEADEEVEKEADKDVLEALSVQSVTDAKVEYNVVCQNSLTSSGVIVDELSDDLPDSDFANKVISYCEKRISVYSQPDTSSEVVGCMYSRSQADVLEVGPEFTKISSGDVVGYVRNVYLLYGEEADKVAPYLAKKTTTVDVDNANVYSSADINSEVIATLAEGTEIKAYDEINMWVFVECENGFGYIDKREISSVYDLDTAMTIEAEQAYLAELARIEAERREAERIAAARKAEAESKVIGRTSNEPMTVSDSDAYLLACIVEWEAGWEPYEGKLAVANVVLNRVRSTRFKQNTIPTVIYSPGQFTGVLDANGNISERFQKLLDEGPKHDDCYTAAGEALAGVNNIDDYLFFISVKKANFSRYIKSTIINNHCFYAY